MKTRLALAAVLVLFISASGGRAGDREEEQKPSFWMQKKLAYSERILAGLASEDFQEIGKNARSMNALGQLEKWVRANTPEYRTQLKLFQYANDQLIRMADDENLDSAALAYVQLTFSCVNCHKLVRHDSQREDPQRPK
jgi:hypothetical protein